MNSSQTQTGTESPKFKLNVKRTMLIGFAFFGILLMWQVYDSWCPTFLSNLFCKTFGLDADKDSERVQYLVGIVMALDNVAALVLMPIFGHLSDKTHTKIGKRMPYILVGTFVCAVAMPFIPVFYHYSNLAGVVAFMAIVVTFGMMYRNPAVALMPDITPKPLRSRANGIINIMGYIGGAFATVVGLIFVLSDYLGTGKAGAETWKYNNIWVIEAPFLIASALMIVSAIVLVFTIKENKLEEELRPELERGEAYAAIEDKIQDDDQPLSKANKRMLFLILGAEFFWFMADNGISTFIGNYTLYYLHTSTANSMINTIVGGIGSVVGFALGGVIASKIGRKWTLLGGLGLTLLAYVGWAVCTFTVPLNLVTNSAGKLVGSFPIYIYIVFAAKGFGMSLVHINSFPMVVELCSKKKIGAFTGYYYASSMAAQTITPIALGSLMLTSFFSWQYLPIYALICVGISFVIFFFVKNVQSKKTTFAKGLEGLGQDD